MTFTGRLFESGLPSLSLRSEYPWGRYAIYQSRCLTTRCTRPGYRAANRRLHALSGWFHGEGSSPQPRGG